ncbi:hypothetical protein M1523_04160 [Patescibacteria group bacterium]|nr:hypothetical protein [Patescibacteria group bacterium]MCL5091884.1 hypothetical protein [Patescibacteria group bacterium]
MVSHQLKSLPKKTFQISVTIPWLEIDQEYKKTFDKLRQTLSVEGFRAGKVPRAIAEKHIAKDKVYQNALQSLISRLYEEIVKKEGLKPIASPKIDLVKAKENEDWQINITLAEKPEIKLGDYKKQIETAHHQGKKTDIWVPGKDKQATKPDSEADKQLRLNQTLEALLKAVSCQVSDLILQEEVSRRLAQTVDDIQKIGLTTETYLKSKNLTLDQLKQRLGREVEDGYRLEFILAEIADQEAIKVEAKEIEQLLTNIKDVKEREQARANAYFYAAILRKQKVLDYLNSL